MSVPVLASDAGKRALAELAAERELDQQAFTRLLEAVERHSGKLRRRGMFQEFDAILDQAGR
jgi:hypothetical protein